MIPGSFPFRDFGRGTIFRVQASGYLRVETHIDLSFTSERGLTVSLKPVRPATISPRGSETVSAHELAIPQGARDLLASGKRKLYVERNPQTALRDFQFVSGQSRTF